MQAKLISPELAKANRAVLHVARQLMALPLEQYPAGRVALVDVSNASAPALAAPPLTLPAVNCSGPAAATTYCAAFDASGRWLYAFAAQTATLYVIAIGEG